MPPKAKLGKKRKNQQFYRCDPNKHYGTRDDSREWLCKQELGRMDQYPNPFTSNPVTYYFEKIAAINQIKNKS